MNDLIQTVREALASNTLKAQVNHKEWLLQLCDQVEAQESEIERIEQERNRLILSLKSSHERTVYDLREAQAKEIERLREALEWYASFWNHDVQLEDIGITSMQRDKGKRAREALSHIKGGEG